jgi:hypothetical protein
LILKDVIIEKKIKIFNIAVLYLLLFACFFYMALYPGSLQTLALKRMQYIGVGGGGGWIQEGQTVGNRQEITATGGRADSRLLE